MKQVTTFKPKTCIVKVERYTAKNWGVETIGIYKTLEEARIATAEYEKTLIGKPYKRTFCMFDEPDGIHQGFCFTLY